MARTERAGACGCKQHLQGLASAQRKRSTQTKCMDNHLSTACRKPPAHALAPQSAQRRSAGAVHGLVTGSSSTMGALKHRNHGTSDGAGKFCFSTRARLARQLGRRPRGRQQTADCPGLAWPWQHGDHTRPQRVNVAYDSVTTTAGHDRALPGSSGAHTVSHEPEQRIPTPAAAPPSALVGGSNKALISDHAATCSA